MINDGSEIFNMNLMNFAIVINKRNNIMTLII